MPVIVAVLLVRLDRLIGHYALRDPRRLPFTISVNQFATTQGPSYCSGVVPQNSRRSLRCECIYMRGYVRRVNNTIREITSRQQIVTSKKRNGKETVVAGRDKQNMRMTVEKGERDWKR